MKHACARRHAAHDAPKVTTPASEPRADFDSHAFRAAYPELVCRSRRRIGGEPCAVVAQLLQAMPTEWLTAIASGVKIGVKPIAANEWVEATRNGASLCVGRVKTPQLFANGNATVEVYVRGASNTLTPTDTMYTYDPSSTDTLTRTTCHHRDGTWFYYGPLDGDRGETCVFTVSGAETLNLPHTKTLCNATAHDFYTILTSQKFEPPTALTEGGLWHRCGLMDVSGPTDAEQRVEMKRILSRTKCRWLSRKQQQTLYMVVTNAVPIGHRVGEHVQPATKPLTSSMFFSTAPQR